MQRLTFITVSVSLSVMMTAAGAGAVLYAKDALAQRSEAGTNGVPVISQTDEPSPATIAAWKASARASDYLSPQVPI